MPTKSQIDRAGERLRRTQAPRDVDRELYEEFREGFAKPLSEVFASLSRLAGDRPVTYRLKRFETTVDKLRRFRSRLSSIEDIAGCRVVLPTIGEKQRLAELVTQEWSVVRTRDYQARPRDGYRALHLVVRAHGRPVEVQLRTELEDRWANTAEALADVVDPDIKYGGGPALVRDVLGRASEMFAVFDGAIALDLRFRGALLAVRDDPGKMTALRTTEAGLDARAGAMHAYLMKNLLEGAVTFVALFEHLEEESVATSEVVVARIRSSVTEALGSVSGLADSIALLTGRLEAVASSGSAPDGDAPPYRELLASLRDLEARRGSA